MAKKREISDFLARELLYDYITGRLDDDRYQAVQQSLKESEDVADDLKALSEGMKYCENLRNTKLTEPLFAALSEPPKTLKDHVRTWKELSPSVRHSIEASGIALVLALIVLAVPSKYLPWQKDGNFTVVEVKREPPKSTDLEVTTVTVTTVPEVVIAKADVETPVKGEVAYGPPLPIEGIQKPTSKVMPDVPIKSASKAVAVEVQKPKISEQQKGGLFRIYMFSHEVDKITPQLIEKINKLGGTKAGEVQLGWRRKQGSYFHFALPESKYEELTTYLQTFGPVRIVKEAHPRVMPPGQIRLILWLEETSPE